MLHASLHGIRVVDFTQIGAGPTCTMFLGDLGADVVKVEPPDGDIGRTLGPPWVGTDSAIHVAFNRNKRSLSLDLKQAAGRDVARRLVGKADVLVESFRPGVMQRFGLDYATVEALNPAIVYCSVSGYGQSGPYAGKAGVDGILQASTGLMSLIGSDGDAPSKVQVPIIDITTGWAASIAVLASLLSRVRTGKGACLDTSLFATGIALQQSSLTAFLSAGELPSKLGSGAPYSAPNEAFRTRDGHLMVAAYTPERWSALCRVLDLPQLRDDDRFASGGARVANRQQLHAILEERFASDSTAAWVQRLEAEDILCSPIADYRDLEQNPQLRHAELFTSFAGGSDAGPPSRVPAFPVKDNGPPLPYRAPPRLGEHTLEILASLDYTDAEVSGFLETGAINAS